MTNPVSELTSPPPQNYVDLNARSLLRGSTPDNDEPPPAYTDLFPPNYKYLISQETVAEVNSDIHAKDETLLSQPNTSEDLTNIKIDSQREQENL